MYIDKNTDDKRIYILYFIILITLYILNRLTPFAYGDDYLYSFVWDESVNGGNMFQPITETARRVDSFQDIFESQWSHYFTWGGRIPAHVLVQFFLWQGKDIFNIVNTFVFLLLLLEIGWLSMGGRVTLNLPVRRMVWIFFAIWTFTPGFCPIMLWLTGACNYLWMMTIVLAFLLPWVRWFHGRDPDGSLWKTVGMFLFGIVAGWTNENTGCFLIPGLCCVIWKARKENMLSSWMCSGWLGLCIGYGFLIFAPGNYARKNIELSMGDGNPISVLQHNIMIFLLVLLVQFVLWYFVLRTRSYYKDMQLSDEDRTCAVLIRFFSVLSFATLSVMMLSPDFPARSGFVSSVFLILAGAMTLQLEARLHLSRRSPSVKKMLYAVGSIYVGMTLMINISNLYGLTNYVNYVYDETKKAIGTDQDVVVYSWKNDKNKVFLDLHTLNIELDEDPSYWSNVVYARYWGIRSIRVTDEKFSMD